MIENVFLLNISLQKSLEFPPKAKLLFLDELYIKNVGSSESYKVHKNDLSNTYLYSVFFFMLTSICSFDPLKIASD